MKWFLVACTASFLFSCNSSSSGKKEKRDSTEIHAWVNVSAVPITAEQLSAAIKFNGKLQQAWQWNDKLGENILITALVEPYADKQKNEYGEEGQSAELNACHYVKRRNDYQLLWKINDGEKGCPFDITCGFINDAVTVTDLDKDGIGEITLLYRIACRSDVSPAEMKLIMYENTDKYSLKGLSWLKSSPEDTMMVTVNDANLETLPGYKKTEDEYMKTFGRYETEKNFVSAPPEFLAYARQQWMKFVIERFD